MPKKIKQHRSSRLRKAQAQEYRRVDEIRRIVGTFTKQSQLDTMLLQQSDPMKRKQLFDFVKPFCKFAAAFPTNLEQVGGLVSVKPQLIRPKQAFESDEHLVIRA